jgi:hypothetical protein
VNKVFIDSNEKDLFDSLPANHKKVLSLIGEGSGNPTTVKSITSLTGFTDVCVRELVSDMVTKYGIKIGTSNRVGNSGFYIIQNEIELNDTVRNLMSRATKIMARARALQDIPNEDQQTLNI